MRLLLSHDMCGFLCLTLTVAVEVCQWRVFRCPTLDDAFFVARHMWVLSFDSGRGSVPVFPVFFIYTFLLPRVVSLSFIVLSLFCFSFFCCSVFFATESCNRFCHDGILNDSVPTESCNRFCPTIVPAPSHPATEPTHPRHPTQPHG